MIWDSSFYLTSNKSNSSSPKLQVLNNALISALSLHTLEEAKQDTEYWGRLVESAVGASLYTGLSGAEAELYYWSGRNREVDFVLSRGDVLVAIEVKSGRRKTNLPGIEAFSKEFKVKRKLLVGPTGIPVDQFLLTPLETLLG